MKLTLKINDFIGLGGRCDGLLVKVSQIKSQFESVFVEQATNLPYLHPCSPSSQNLLLQVGACLPHRWLVLCSSGYGKIFKGVVGGEALQRGRARGKR